MGKFKQGNILVDKVVFGDATEQDTAAYTHAECNTRFLGTLETATDSLKLSGAYRSTDGTLYSNSDALVATEKAFKTYQNSLINCLEMTLSPTNFDVAVDDGVQLYFGSGVGWNPFALGAVRSLKNGTIKIVSITGNSWGTPSNENTDFYIGIGSNFYLVGGVGLSTGYYSVFNSSLSLPVTVNDDLLIKLWAPTYATNPTAISANASVYIEY